MTVPPADPYLPGHGDRSYGVTHYDLELTYRPASNRLDATATIDAVAHGPLQALVLDLAGRLRVRKVSVDGVAAKRYAHRQGRLHVTLDAPRAAGTRLRVVVAYTGSPAPERGTWGEVGWEELTEGSLVAGQPDGAPTWFPCNDRPDDKASYRIAVTTDSPFTAVANGMLAERRSRAGTTTWVYEQPEPMAGYLATVQIGRYDVRDLEDVDAVAQQLVRPARLARAAAHDFGRQPQMLRLFTRLFGAYPFRSYTVVVTDDPLEIPLEAQGVSIFGANHVDGRRGAERLVAHELAHQWFGNSLTVARWRDIWLNEGFACYAEWLWSEHSDGPTAHAHAERYWKRLRGAKQDLVLVDPGPELMFDDRVYKRGALTLHALRTTVGDDTFFDLLRSWVAQHRHGVVDSPGFVEHVEDAAGAAAAELLTPWLTEPELPPLPRR